ncbi:filament-like plant protein 7 [Canna indica]|uniref:Filament-like plant protein 7 n=1 Tax=Canna indica TaxID=4628 RepID=A0AAQ3KU32_9LILI|nr:filament-like plant protein 7 [Canna indica]
MDNKTWLWKKKSSEKSSEKEKALELERSLEELNEQLSSIRTESNAKDGLLAKQAKVAEEAIAGWQKAEAEAISLKQQLDDALLQKKTAEERVVDRDAALKECMQQLHVVKEDQQFIVNNAALKISREQEKIRALEQRLVETNKRLTEVVIENGNLNRMIEVKEQLLKELSESKSKTEANLAEVKGRLDSLEKLNASLKYELCMLQKELEIRHEEREFNHRSSNAAHRQNLENVKKIARLETECQRLRVMVRKRLPGPTALVKMRNEVEMLGNNSTETRRKRSSSISDDFNIKDIVLEDCYDASSKGAGALVDRLRVTEDENKIIKESLTKKNNELQASRLMLARTTTKLSHVEKQLEDLSKGQVSLELARSSPMSYDLPLSSISEHGGNDDNISCAESWASALISELEHFKSVKPTGSSCRSVGASELSLMDDFVEMEKLAVISVDKHFESSVSAFGDSNSCVTTRESCAGLDLSEAMGKELVPIKDLSRCSEANSENQVRCISLDNHPRWLQDILRVIIQKHHIKQKSINAILDDVRVALGDWNHSTEGKCSDNLNCSEKVLQHTKHTSLSSFDGTINKSSTLLCQSDLEKSVHKLIELVEGIIHKSMKRNNQDTSSGESEGTIHRRSASASGYIARAFLWESSELASVLQKFVVVCNDLLCGKVDLQLFTTQVASTLDWIINHCFSLRDVSDMKETIRKHLGADESNSDNELKSIIYPSKELGKLDSYEEPHTGDEKSPVLSASNGLYILSRMDDAESKLKDENERLKYEIMSMESRKKDLEEVLKKAGDTNEALMAQLRESEANISNLQLELAALKEFKGQIEDQIINQKLINEDLGTKLSVAKAELKEAHQKFSSLEVELEEKSNCCEELEATCLELQLQIESASIKETPKYVLRQEEKQIQAECDIVAASEKLAACQETIVNLGKQLKAMASPKDAPLFDKVISSPAAANSKRRLQLVDHMREEDHAKLQSPNTKEIICTEAPTSLPASEKPSSKKSSVKSIIEQSPEQKTSADPRMLMVVPKKQKGGRFLRSILLRKRKH